MYDQRKGAANDVAVDGIVDGLVFIEVGEGGSDESEIAVWGGRALSDWYTIRKFNDGSVLLLQSKVC